MLRFGLTSNGASGSTPVDTIFDINTWNTNQAITQSIDWTKVQMVWMEYAWYGAGACAGALS
jgi:hypothetical protein